MTNKPVSPSPGLPYALAAYGFWGIVPIYFKWLSAIPPVEIVAQRILWTIPLLAIIMAFRGQLREFAGLWRNRQFIRNLFVSASLIGTNWLAFVWAINAGHILATSVAYYLNPLVNVLLGRLFLGERLSRTQRVAVAIASVGVALLAFEAREMLWVSLFLAFSFAGYGLIRKVTPVASVPGLAVETVVLAPIALIAAIWFIQNQPNTGFGSDMRTSLMLITAGAVTALPLLMFATAARRMRFAALGFCQYLAPSISFCLGVFVYGEAMGPTRLISFALIWLAIAVYSTDAIATLRKERSLQRQAINQAQ